MSQLYTDGMIKSVTHLIYTLFMTILILNSDVAFATPVCTANSDPGLGAQRVRPSQRNRGLCQRGGHRRLPTSGRRSGTDLAAELNNRGLSGTARDNQIVNWVAEGQVPNFLNNLQPVSFPLSTDCGGGNVTICTMPDYLTIGTDNDHFRVHLGLPAIQALTRATDFLIPTPAMVDRIYQSATIRVTADPRTENQSTAQMVEHHCSNQNAVQQGVNDYNPTQDLVAGHRKDVVIDPRLERNRGRVAIYGWNNANGSTIQPLSTVHGENYADYSHGVRLISRTAYVNGRPHDLAELLSTHQCARAVLSRNGPISQNLLNRFVPPSGQGQQGTRTSQ
jgi:hypothetical protein